MTRSNLVIGGTAALALIVAGWLFFENRGLEDDLAASRNEVAAAKAETTQVLNRAWGEDGQDGRSGAIKPPATARLGDGPALDVPPRESVMSRRARITDMIASLFGRNPGESEEDYKARVVPLMQMYLDKPRAYATKRRKQAEDKAGVTPEQSAKIDAEVNKIYGDVIDYTNQAVSDGQVSPYSRNVSGWLQYAGGLGSILTDAESRFGKILNAQQIKAMSDMGFEWGEYLGANAPWESLHAPPPPPGGGS